MSGDKAVAIEEPTLFGDEESERAAKHNDGRSALPKGAAETSAEAEGSSEAKPVSGQKAARQDEALQVATERADRLEAEMEELKKLVEEMAARGRRSPRRAEPDAGVRTRSSGDSSSAARAKNDAAEALARAVHGDRAGEDDDVQNSPGIEEHRGGGKQDSRGGEGSRTLQAGAHAKGGVPLRNGSSSGDSESRREARARIDAGDDASSSKEPASPSSAAGEPGMGGGEAELRQDSMMAHLLDSLEANEDIGHYGRLVFVMVARHFLPHDEVLGWLMKDEDLGDEEAQQMLLQVEQRDYSPPRRERILQWQAEQEFPILPDVDDPDSGNVYKNLNFPKEIYKHIGHYREQKAEAAE